MEKEMENTKRTTEDMEPSSSSTMDSFQRELLHKIRFGGESTDSIKSTSPYLGRHHSPSHLSSDDSCPVVFCGRNIARQSDPPSDPSLKSKSPPNKEIKTTLVAHKNITYPHIRTQTHSHTHNAPLSSGVALAPEIGANFCTHTNTATAPAFPTLSLDADSVFPTPTTTPATMQPRTHTHTHCSLSPNFSLGSDFSREKTLAHTTHTTHTTKTMDPAFHTQAMDAAFSQFAHQQKQQQHLQPQPRPRKSLGNVGGSIQHNNSTITQVAMTTAPSADYIPPAASHKSNKRLLSSSPNSITGDNKRIFRDETLANQLIPAHREKKILETTQNTIARPASVNNDVNSPVKIQSVELLRNFFSQLKDKDSKSPPKSLPPKAPKTTYSQVLQQEPGDSMPIKTGSSASLSRASSKKPIPPRTNESSSVDMGPVSLNVKATIHTSPDRHLQQQSPFDPKKTPAFKSLFAQKLYTERQVVRAEANRQKGNGDREGSLKNSHNSINTFSRNSNINKTSSAMAPPIVPLMSLPLRTPNNPIALAQCHRCQKFGHKKGVCRRAFLCMKCAGPHPTTACKKPRSKPPRCCNCGGRHISAYKGCRVYQELKKKLGQDNLRNETQKGRHQSYPLDKNMDPTRRRHQFNSQQQQKQYTSNYWNILHSDKMSPESHPPASHRSSNERRNPFTQRQHKSLNSRSRMAQPTKQRKDPPPSRQQSQHSERWDKLQLRLLAVEEQQKQAINEDRERIKKVLQKVEELGKAFNKMIDSLNKIVTAFDTSELSFNNTKMRSICNSVEMESLDEEDSLFQLLNANDAYYK